MRILKIVAGSVLLLPLILSAQTTNTGTLGVTCTVQSSLGITILQDSSGLSLTGTGTNAATAALGTVRVYGGSLAVNLTRTLTAEVSATYSTPFIIRVVDANITSATYKLDAALGSPVADHSILIDTTDISSAGATVNATQAYRTDIAHTLKLLVLDSSVNPTVNDVVTFTVTAN